MVAICNIEDDCVQNPKTLGDWVKNFRLKKMQMKRKFRSGGDLRICAILSTALMSAELELRRKQQERFQKWLDFQTKINKNRELQPINELRHRFHHESDQDKEESCKQNEQVENLWKYELSELDNFMRSISSSSSSSSRDSKNFSKNCDNFSYQTHSTRNQSIQVSS